MNLEESGAVAVEYALVVGLVALAIVAAVLVLGDDAVTFIQSIDLGLGGAGHIK